MNSDSDLSSCCQIRLMKISLGAMNVHGILYDFMSTASFTVYKNNDDRKIATGWFQKSLLPKGRACFPICAGRISINPRALVHVMHVQLTRFVQIPRDETNL